jgi:hypothetical protein
MPCALDWSAQKLLSEDCFSISEISFAFAAMSKTHHDGIDATLEVFQFA